MSDYVIWDASAQEWLDWDAFVATQEWPEWDVFPAESAAAVDAIIAEADAGPPPTLDDLLALAEGPPPTFPTLRDLLARCDLAKMRPDLIDHPPV